MPVPVIRCNPVSFVCVARIMTKLKMGLIFHVKQALHEDATALIRFMVSGRFIRLIFNKIGRFLGICGFICQRHIFVCNLQQSNFQNFHIQN